MALIFVLFACAISTKEHAVSLPALLLLTDYFWNPGFTFQGIRKNWRLYVPMLVGATALASVVAYRVMGSALSAGFAMKDVKWYEYLFTQFGVFFVYLRLYVLPVKQNADYDYPFARSLFDHAAIIWLVVFLVCLGAAWHYRRRYPLAAYGLFTVVLLLAPTSSILPIKDPIAERRMYLPMIGYLWLTFEGLRRIRARPAAMTLWLGAILLVAAAAAYGRNRVWSGAIPLWEDTVSKSPNKRRARFQLAFAYYEAGRCADAVREYAVTARLEPADYDLLADWALAYDCLRQHDQALAKLREAAALQPTAHAYALMGMIFAKQAHWAAALEAFATAEKTDPGFAMTYVYRGNVYLQTGRPAAAIIEFQRALSLEPENPHAHAGLVSAQTLLQQAPRR
jgi:tetratricopeptide (TPR) repeat protein